MSNQVVELRTKVDSILTEKNHTKVPATIEGLLVKHAGAIALGKYDKAEKYYNACLKFAHALKAREIKEGIELVDTNEIPVDVLKNRALIHASKVRELAILRERINAKEKDVQNSLAKIPDSQMNTFKEYLKVAQDAAHSLEFAVE